MHTLSQNNVWDLVCLQTSVTALSVTFNKRARYNSLAKWHNVAWLVSVHFSSRSSSPPPHPTPPGEVATSRLLTMSSALHDLSLERWPSTDWESKPSNEPWRCQGTCQERGGSDDCGPVLSLCLGLVLFTGTGRARSQRGQDESTALNVFSTLGTFALLALAMFSHAPLWCIRSFPSPPCFPPLAPYLFMHVWDRWSEQKACNYTSSWSCPLMIGNFSWILICTAMHIRRPGTSGPGVPVTDLEWRTETLPPFKKVMFPGIYRTAEGCLLPCQRACNSVCTPVNFCRNRIV